ncbi:hypothetical protein [Aliiglaciecola lipolytica]|uniref:hypothetical protein n=1 Tax=Aliiglaciecola lipolytica TaxID=477689 RepID=UPI001C097DF3|nr:hypothetical protein [Aliiglaciecola lipolytica]MBU2877936.1 hypothetical protein [Aliiglaciecola lipolytica]
MKIVFIPFICLMLVSCNSANQIYSSTAEINDSGNPVTPNSNAYPASLMWKNGVPYLNVDRPEDKHLRGFNQHKTALVWQVGQNKIEVNPINMQFHFGVKDKTQTSSLSFEIVTTAGDKYSLKLQLPPNVNHAFPIRLIETGNWFQYLSFHEFSLVPDNNVDQIIDVEGHLDWKAWHNSGSISLTLKSTKQVKISAINPVWSNQGQGINPAIKNKHKQNITLALAYNLTANQEVQWFDLEQTPVTDIKVVSKHSTVSFEAANNAWEIKLPEIEQSKRLSRTSLDVLNRTTTNRFSLSNDSAQAQTVNLRFIHPKHSKIGFVPILRDHNGIQTGWPIQVSKNWHVRAGLPRIENDGAWIHTSISLKVPAKSHHNYTYEIVHANWNGVPAASVAQLSLVGWGGNGFWLQAALGNWSEHFCFQPGRALRRSMITDIRPLFQKGMKNKSDDKGYDWTSNIGGGDTGLLHDENGRYIQWKQAKTEFHSLGPILSEVSIAEITTNDSATLRSTFIMPRSDDLNRSYIKLEFEVLKPLAISRFALFQFGTDYYASGRSLSVKYGQGNKVDELSQQLTPLQSAKQIKSAAVPWPGNAPWALLPAQLNPHNLRTGYGNRAAILRDFNATIAGKKLNNAWLHSYEVGDNNEAGNVNIELGIDPQITQLMPGDIINATVEVLALPASANFYVGKDANIKEIIKGTNGIQALTINEAVKNQVTIIRADGTNVESTLPEITYAEAIQGFSVSGGQGWYPIKVIGLPRPTSVYWAEKVNTGYEPLGSSFDEEKEAQWNWQADNNTWNSVLSLRSLKKHEQIRRFKLIPRPALEDEETILLSK